MATPSWMLTVIGAGSTKIEMEVFCTSQLKSAGSIGMPSTACHAITRVAKYSLAGLRVDPGIWRIMLLLVLSAWEPFRLREVTCAPVATSITDHSKVCPIGGWHTADETTPSSSSGSCLYILQGALGLHVPDWYPYRPVILGCSKGTALTARSASSMYVLAGSGSVDMTEVPLSLKQGVEQMSKLA